MPVATSAAITGAEHKEQPRGARLHHSAAALYVRNFRGISVPLAGRPVSSSAAAPRSRIVDSARAPMFIVGCQSSGTTPLRLMLDSHRNIACRPETRFLADFAHLTRES
jgi:hypothetical protein